MARTDFYILSGNTKPSRFTCSIASKAFAQGHTVYIVAADPGEAESLDDLLWTYHDISFLPHARMHDNSANAPVSIGWPGIKPPEADVMINLTESVPEGTSSFARVVEIVADVPAKKELGRKRYKYYRDHGFELYTHNIDTEHASD